MPESADEDDEREAHRYSVLYCIYAENGWSPCGFRLETGRSLMTKKRFT